MSFYEQFNTCYGRYVEVNVHDGRIYRGTVHHVDEEYVYIQSTDYSGGGADYGFNSYYFGFFPGAGIVALALASVIAFSIVY